MSRVMCHKSCVTCHLPPALPCLLSKVCQQMVQCHITCDVSLGTIWRSSLYTQCGLNVCISGGRDDDDSAIGESCTAGITGQAKRWWHSDTGKGVVRDMAPLQVGWWHESSCNFRYELLNARFSGWLPSGRGPVVGGFSADLYQGSLEHAKPKKIHQGSNTCCWTTVCHHKW